MKNSWFSLLKYNKFTFGNQHVSQFVFFECKYLFSIILFYFHKTTGEQDRFHTHAFNALSIKLFGKYNEYILEKKEPEIVFIKERKKIFQYFPRNCYHKIGQSNGCCTILLSGPWKRKWEEYKNNTTTYYTWGRKQ